MTRFCAILGFVLAAGCAGQRQPRATADCIDPSRVNPGSICTMEYDPVCGCNGLTYANACVARNAGLRTFRPGPCPSRP